MRERTYIVRETRDMAGYPYAVGWQSKSFDFVPIHYWASEDKAHEHARLLNDGSGRTEAEAAARQHKGAE